MPSNRPSRVCLPKPPSIDDPSREERAPGDDAAHCLIRSEDFRMKRPGWAGFRMEAAYWDFLQDICAADNIRPTDFIKAAKHQSPELGTAAAVRVQIASYFRQLVSRYPTTAFTAQAIAPILELDQPKPNSPEPLAETERQVLLADDDRGIITSSAPVAFDILVVDDVAMNRDIISSSCARPVTRSSALAAGPRQSRRSRALTSMLS
jgi:hypothetical protein